MRIASRAAAGLAATSQAPALEPSVSSPPLSRGRRERDATARVCAVADSLIAAHCDKARLAACLEHGSSRRLRSR
jgi:hypothetical protein